VSGLAAMAAALATGLFLGLVLAAVYAASTRSFFQERMQRKVLYWQGETVRARRGAEQLARRLEALGACPESPAERE
jgi:hypothetical protein